MGTASFGTITRAGGRHGMRFLVPHNIQQPVHEIDHCTVVFIVFYEAQLDGYARLKLSSGTGEQVSTLSHCVCHILSLSDQSGLSADDSHWNGVPRFGRELL
jgi:hypothetical protein